VADHECSGAGLSVTERDLGGRLVISGPVVTNPTPLETSAMPIHRIAHAFV